MRRPLIIAVLCAIALLPANLEAQSRGMAHRGGFPSSRGSVVITGRVPRVVIGGSLRRPTVAFGRRYFNVPLAGAPYSLAPATVFQPFAYAPPIYTAPYVSIQEIPSRNSKQVNELSYEVERLTREVQRLREEQRRLRDSRQTAPEPPPSTETPTIPAILVFRDSHQMEVQGYAIVGQTLWAVTEQTSTKISLSDLDLEATQKLNAERGVRFPLPRKP